MFTQVVEHPFFDDPAYLQKCHCLRKAGFPEGPPEFHVEIAPENLKAAGLSPEEFGTFFHLRPFTKTEEKECSGGRFGA